MKVYGILRDELVSITADKLASATKNNSVPAIWSEENGLILIALDDDSGGTEKSPGDSGTHYGMRILNYHFNCEFLGNGIDMTHEDTLPGCIDFDIKKRGNQIVATLPHSVAKYIPFVVGVEKATVANNWLERLNSSGWNILRTKFEYASSPLRGVVVWKVRHELDQMAKAAKSNTLAKSEYIDSLFASLSENEGFEVAIVETKLRSGCSRFVIARSHQGAGYNKPGDGKRIWAKMFIQPDNSIKMVVENIRPNIFRKRKVTK